MTLVRARPRRVNGYVGGMVQDAEPGVLPLGAITEGENLVALPSGLQQTRGGSRLVRTLSDDAGTPAELTHVCLFTPFTPVGAVAIGWSNGQNKHYAYRLTDAIAFFTGSEATSRADLAASPSTTWDNASEPARPVAAELFEKLFIADATLTAADRNEFLSLDSSGSVLRPAFSFDGGSAEPLFPFCLEEYNGVLFIAGYGDGSDQDRREMVRHSFLARSPDDTTSGVEGFDKDAYNLLGAKGQRVTAMKKGRGLLLVAKEDEFYRISGFGRAYPGWQYAVEGVQNTQGLGVSNPHALAFAQGFWYGIGNQGPMRTDGYNVESLVGPRQRGWRAMNQVETSWVAYHPERRVILFGVHPTAASAGRSDTYPWVIWVWDLERDVWQTDWKFGADFFMGSALTPAAGSSAASTGPSAPPSSPSTTDETTSGYTANWTNGDSSADTELWEKEGAGGTWTLVTTIAAGTATYARTGRTNHTLYYWKVRHRKSGVTTVYATETEAYTLIAAPDISFTCLGFGGYAEIYITQNAPGTDIVYEQPPGTVKTTFTNKPAGQFLADTIETPAPTAARAKSTDATWPSGTDSDYDVVTGVDC